LNQKIVFHRNLGCTSCDLSACGQKSTCIPTRPLNREIPKSSQALLVLGEAPGLKEDEACKCFVGVSGKYLTKAYLSWLLQDDLNVDVYLSNSVRCRLPKNYKPALKNYKACSAFFHLDLEALSKRYSSITLLCVGAIATAFLFKQTLTQALNNQGQLYRYKDQVLPTYSTFHPAGLTAGREPSKILSVQEHLSLLKDSLKRTPPSSLSTEMKYSIGKPPPEGADLICLDIETYGAIKGPEQRYFHPRKSQILDGIPRNELIVSVAITDATTKKSYWYEWKDLSHRQYVRDWLAKARTVLCHNTLFDISYLRYADYKIKELLDARYLQAAGNTNNQSTLRLWDTTISNYLHSDVRPEKSLKSLSPLFGFGSYERTAANYRFKDGNDPLLREYNVVDTLRTLELFNFFRRKIRERYGEQTAKLTDYCKQWYSDLIWTVLHMSEAGIHMDRKALTTLLEEKTKEKTKLDKKVFMDRGGGLEGHGSNNFIQEEIFDIIQQGPRFLHARLQKTPAKQEYSTNDENLELLLTNIKNEKDLEFLHDLRSHRAARKIVTTYTAPFLSENNKKRMVNDFFYPSWFIVPSKFKDESAEKEGGTSQSRLAAHNPGVQTFPDSVQKCISSRWRGGSIISADLSQIELRTAALLSDDPVMLKDYQMDRDLHAATAKRLFDVENPTKEQRQGGKETNFLTLYRGGAETLQKRLRLRGIKKGFTVCVEWIKKYWEQHPVLWKWQNDLIEEVKQKGYLELALIGQSRLYLGNARSRERAQSTIVNQPVQTYASNILLSAKSQITYKFKSQKMKSQVILSVHDSVKIDTLKNEREEVKCIVGAALLSPPFFVDLCNLLDRTIPLKYDLEES